VEALPAPAPERDSAGRSRSAPVGPVVVGDGVC
jgi:hypothetical protein